MNYSPIPRHQQLCKLVVALTIMLVWAWPAHSQQQCIRIMKQDSTLNNLVDPPGYKTAKIGTLGSVLRVGTGTQPMILIPGLGFSGSDFSELMEGLSDKYKMYAVTLPGFGGTSAPPCPSEQTSFSAQSWTNSALQGLEELITDEKLEHPIIVGHWLTGTQLALRLALKYPDRIKAVMILSGAHLMYLSDTAYSKYYKTPQMRIASTDNYMAPKWFKTVTRETWDDNNFLPGDYAVNPVRGLRLWREAAAPLLHVWVRYLNEFNAQDMTADLPNLKVPTLILEPGLEGLQVDPAGNYMDNYCHKSWEGVVEKISSITVRTIPNSRVCLWFDQPEAVRKEVTDFLNGLN